MKLYLTAKSEKGKEAKRGGQEFIGITLTREIGKERIPKYFITFRQDDLIVEDIPVEEIVFQEKKVKSEPQG